MMSMLQITAAEFSLEFVQKIAKQLQKMNKIEEHVVQQNDKLTTLHLWTIFTTTHFISGIKLIFGKILY